MRSHRLPIQGVRLLEEPLAALSHTGLGILSTFKMRASISSDFDYTCTGQIVAVCRNSSTCEMRPSISSEIGYTNIGQLVASYASHRVQLMTLSMEKVFVSVTATLSLKGDTTGHHGKGVWACCGCKTEALLQCLLVRWTTPQIMKSAFWTCSISLVY